MAASVEPGAPTQYLQVTGMVTPDVLVDDEEYSEVHLCTTRQLMLLLFHLCPTLLRLGWDATRRLCSLHCTTLQTANTEMLLLCTGLIFELLHRAQGAFQGKSRRSLYCPGCAEVGADVCGGCVAQVIQDLQEECSKYGQVLRVLVPRPPNPAAANELFGSNNYGKVGHCVPYIRYAPIHELSRPQMQ